MSFLAAFFSPRVIALVAIALALAMGGRWCYVQGAKGVQSEWDADIAQRTAQALAASEAARATEQALQTRVGRIDRAYQDQKRATATVAAAAADGLRNLEAILAAPAGASSSAVAASGNYGAGGLERELLGNCAAALAELGRTADRLEGKVVALQEYIKATARPGP